MAIGKNFPAFVNPDETHLGDGYLFIGDANTNYDETAILAAGCLAGTATLRRLKEIAELKVGSPLSIVKAEPQEIGVELEVTFVEMNCERMSKILGFGNITSSGGNLVNVVNEKIELVGEHWFHLQGYGIQETPVDLVLKDNSPTPVSYTVDVDYKLDRVNGLIRRISTGAIFAGGAVYATYVWHKSNTETLKVGSHKTINWYPLKFVVPLSSGKRHYVKIWKAFSITAPESSYQSDDFTKTTVVFRGMIDLTKPVDANLYEEDYESA